MSRLDRRRERRTLWLAAVIVLAGCGQGEGEPVAISLVDRFRTATVEHAVETDTGPPRIRWRFDGGASLEAADHLAPTQGWEALHGVEGLAIRESKLAGKVTGRPVLAAAVPAPPDDTDSFHAFQIEIRVAAGSRLGVRGRPSPSAATARSPSTTRRIRSTASRSSATAGS